MRKLLLAALIAAGSAMAEDSPFLKGEAMAAEVAKNCADGCVVLSPAEAEALTLSIQEMVDEREQRAYDAGRKHEYESCRNRI